MLHAINVEYHKQEDIDISKNSAIEFQDTVTDTAAIDRNKNSFRSATEVVTNGGNKSYKAPIVKPTKRKTETDLSSKNKNRKIQQNIPEPPTISSSPPHTLVDPFFIEGGGSDVISSESFSVPRNVRAPFKRGGGRRMMTPHKYGNDSSAGMTKQEQRLLNWKRKRRGGSGRIVGGGYS